MVPVKAARHCYWNLFFGQRCRRRPRSARNCMAHDSFRMALCIVHPRSALPYLVPISWWLFRPLREHPGVTAADAALMDAKGDKIHIAWRDLVRNRTVWGVVLPRMLSHPVWYFYIFWIPDYL